jgi:hypothetical protein
MAVTEIKKKKFIKSLFLCLCLERQGSVDKLLQAFVFVMYRELKLCGHVLRSPLDNAFKPVD